MWGEGGEVSECWGGARIEARAAATRRLLGRWDVVGRGAGLPPLKPGSFLLPPAEGHQARSSGG